MLSVLSTWVTGVAAVTVVLLGPGLLCARCLRLRWLPALACATGLTCTLVGAAATLTTQGVTPLHWGLPLLVAATLAAAAVAAAVGRLLPAPPRRDSVGLHRAALAGACLGTLSLGLGLALSIRRLDAVPAQPDATYHLNSIRSIMQGGDASSLDDGAFLYGRTHSYYPSTFHALGATAAQLVGAQPVVVANALSFVAGSLIWTLGCVLLCRQAFGRNRAALVLGGVAAGSFVVMPFWIAGYGPLWPLVLGYAVGPGLIGCLLSLLKLARQDAIGRPQAAIVLVATISGLGFVHPAAVAAIVLVTYPLVVVAAIRTARRRSPVRAAGLVTLALVGLPLGWWAATRVPRIDTYTHTYAAGPTETRWRAGFETLLNAEGRAAVLFLTSAVLLVGLVVVVRTSRLRWAAATYLLLAATYFSVAAVQSGLTRAVTVFWYNERPRVAAMIPLAGVPVLTAGLLWLRSRALLLRERGGRPISSRLALVLVLVVYLAGTLGNNLPAAVARLHPVYHGADPTTVLLPVSGDRHLEQLARSVPRDAVVADNPWRGHALLYAFGARHVVFYSEKAVTSPDRKLVADQLYLAGTTYGGLVCGAVRRLGVTYVITGGANALPNLGGRDAFLGVDRVPGRPGFTPVARSGPYRLWQITACS